MRGRSRPIHTRSMVVVTTAALILAAVPTAVWAADWFTDVPDSNVFHEDITWLAEQGVTRGCNPPDNDRFCPDDNVTREQMAAFMHRLGDSLLEEAVIGANTGLEAQLAAANRATAAYQDVDAGAVCRRP